MSRRQFGSINDLTIKGMGFASVDNQMSSINTNITNSKPSGKKTTVTTTLRKSGSIGNMRTLFNSSESAQKRTCGICTCHLNRSQAAKLQEQYTRNLRQQIYFLELENSYLRGNDESKKPENMSGTSGKKLFTKSNLPDNPIKSIIKRKESSVSSCDTKSGQYDLKPHLAIDQAELLQKLEEAYQRELRIEERLKSKIVEVRELETENERLLRKVRESEASTSKVEDACVRDKRALMEELVELQRRLDNLTPSLANKESQIAKLENEKEILTSKLRNATTQLNSLQLRIGEGKREEAALSTLEAERREETDRLLKTIRRIESDLEEAKEKDRCLTEELNASKRSLREEQLRAKKDRAIAEKTGEENNALIIENSSKAAEISRLEANLEEVKKECDTRRVNEINPTEHAMLRDMEKSVRAELMRVQEKLRSEQERIQYLESQLEDHERSEELTRDARLRMQKELDALRALSESLSNENKLLRQEKYSLKERCEELLKKGNMMINENTSARHETSLLTERNREMIEKLDLKENEISIAKYELKQQIEKNQELQRRVDEREDELRKTRMRCDTTDRYYRQILAQLERETKLQHERTNDYEELANRVKELSASIKEPKNLNAPFFNETLKYNPLISTSTQQSSKRIIQSNSVASATHQEEKSKGHDHETT